MLPVIDAQQVRYSYSDGTSALNGIDFHLYPGETVALLGRNGSGKTTFVLHLNGLLQGEGTIQVCGMAVCRQNLAAIRAKVGMVFQDSDEQLFMPTVLEDVAFGPRNLGLGVDHAVQRAREALSQTGVADLAGRAPYHLSAGEKRRVALAGVLAMSPEVLVLDEPTTFLDPPAERELIRLLKSLPQAKIVVTHDMPFARALATRAVFFEKGRVVANGPIEEIASRFHWEI
ncbi:MAG: ABC transporter ATP-binding protein [Candidatus Solibacter usitatus]|nr:ABC transporter ATP-binding protein [Candidatus Solibacter usitatus]